VKPVVLIEHLRKEAVRQHLYSVETLRRFKSLSRRFQRVRWHATAECLQGRAFELSDRTWNEWLEKPTPQTYHVIDGKALFAAAAAFSSTMAKLRATACFTCGECSSACPISCERSTFDPRAIFRTANLGLMQDLFLSPSIWLCISCGRCSEACSQLVDGKTMIAAIQKMAHDSGAVDRSFAHRLEKAEKIIYTRFLREIDALFGCIRPHQTETGEGVKPLAVCV
jgi:Fe-S oxidoreductase